LSSESYELPGNASTHSAGAAAGDLASGPRRVGRNVSALAVGQLITWSMTLLWTLVVPRTLGPSGMGTIMAAWAITGILGVVLGLGTRNYLVRESVAAPETARGLIGTALVLRLLLSPFLFGAAFAYGQVVGWTHDAMTVLYLAAAASLFIQITEPLGAAFQAIERMEYLAYSDIISKSGQGLMGIVVVLLGAGTIGVTACWAVMTGLVVVLNVYWLRGRLTIDLHTTWRQLVAMARASLPYWACGLFFTIYLWIDFVMLSLLAPSEVVGWYSVPTRLFQTLLFLPVVVGTAWLPGFVRGFEQGRERLRNVAKPPLELVLLLSLPIATLTVLGAKPVIDLLYGSAYRQSIPVMVILGLCIPPMYMNILMSQVVVAMNRQVVWTWVMLGTTVVNPPINLALIPLTQHAYGNGAIGAAISLLLTELICVGAGYALIGRLVFDRGTARRTTLGLGIAGAMWGVGYTLALFAGWVPGILAAAATFVVLAGLLRLFTAEEVELIRSGFGRVVNRVPGVGRLLRRSERSGPAEVVLAHPRRVGVRGRTGSVVGDQGDAVVPGVPRPSLVADTVSVSPVHDPRDLR
jgi:O-antigen/teichoic acid export membrane protein